MGEELGDGQIGRRDLLKKGAVAGGLIWASPTIFSATAGAQVGACTSCPSDRLFGLKFNNPGTLESLPTNGGGGGNCLDATAAAPPACFDGFFTAPKQNGSDSDGQHTWVLQPSLELCQVAAKVGQGQATTPFDSNGCYTCSAAANCDSDIISISVQNGVTTVVVTDSALSHSEILFCYKGSPLSCLD